MSRCLAAIDWAVARRFGAIGDSACASPFVSASRPRRVLSIVSVVGRIARASPFWLGAAGARGLRGRRCAFFRLARSG